MPDGLTFDAFFLVLGGKMNDYLKEEKIPKLMIKFSLPCILSLLVSALYNIVDQIFIGNSDVGTIGNTATTIVFPLTVIALAFGLMLGDGAAANMSLLSGKGNDSDISKTVVNSLETSFFVSLIFLLICFPFLNQILTFFGAKTVESLEKANEYGFIILIGVPFYIVSNTLNSIIRADGSPKISMLSMISGAVTNVILDAIFILLLNWGLTGAALATIIGQILSFIISFIYLFKAKTFKIHLDDFKINFRLFFDVLKLGFSSFLTQISIVIITVISMNMLATYGAQSKYGINDPQAIIGIVMKVFSIVVNIAVGIMAGSQPIVGYNYGAGRYDRVKKVFFYVIVSNIVLGILATLVFELFPGFIINIFGSNTSNKELYIEFGIYAMRIYLGGILLTLIQKVSSIFLQSIGSPIKALLLSLIRDVFAMSLFTIVLPIQFGIIGILIAAPVSDIIGIIFTVIFITIELRKMKRVKNNDYIELN